MGILALQLDIVSRDAFLEAMRAWVLAKEVPLVEHLIRGGGLKPHDRQLLEPLVEAHIRQHGGDPHKSLASVSPIGSLKHQLEQIGDEQLHATLAYVAQDRSAALPDDPYATIAAGVGHATSKGTRFRILRPHAEGGLGQVFVARDEEVRRDVALKEIKPRWADDPDSRARFTREAEITGGLEHPGIVPVYGLGAYPDGRPFYAMRFIRGKSLKDAMDDFSRANAGTNPLSASERNLEQRRLLQRLIDVCEAIDYAHSRGVLHRDLKPGNIMLGRHGETLVVDWGLAKALGKSPADAARSAEQPSVSGPATLPELPLVPSSGDSEPTMLGSAIGTPGFMSPEQAEGRLDLLGPASDVFSLGATLYQLLTGVPPYAEEDVLRQAREARYALPRRVRPDIPRPLEAICLKAMAPLPQNRYASAKELADEIERWLAGEPVAAYPEGTVDRVLRWARKHRAWVTAGGLALAAVTAITTVAFVVVSFQNWRISNLAEAETAARKDAQIKRQEAETARDDQAKAHQAAKASRDQARQDRAMLAEIVDQLGQDAYRNRRHRPLLESSVINYREFLSREQDAPSDQLLLRARFQGKLATLLESLDDYSGAQAAYQASIDQYESLRDSQSPADQHQIRSELGSTYGNLGAMYVQTSQAVAALTPLDKAIAIQRKLVDEYPRATGDRRELARHSYNRGFIRANFGLPGAIEDLQAAVNLQQPLVDGDPQSSELSLELAVMQVELGARLAAAAPTNLPEAQRIIPLGVARLEDLIRRDPHNSEYRKELADGQAELGQVLAMNGDAKPAIELLGKSLDGFTQLVRDFPADADFKRGLGLARFSLGLTKELSSDLSGAQSGYRSAAEIQQKLVADFPDRTLFWIDAAKTWTNLSQAQFKDKQLDAALASIYQAVADMRQAWQLSQYAEQLRPAVYQVYYGQAQIAIQAGNHAALWDLGQSHAELLPSSGRDAFDAARLISLAVPLVTKDSTLPEGERSEKAVEYARRAIELLDRAFELGFRDLRAIQSEPDLAPLRSRAEFQQLLQRLDVKN